MKKIMLSLLLITIFIIGFGTTNTFASTGIVKGDSINVRQEANTTSNVLTSINNGVEVEILEEVNNWYKIQYNGNIGYIRNDFLQKKENITEEVVTDGNDKMDTSIDNVRYLKEDAKVYITPLINSEIISNVQKDTNVSVISSVNGWVYIKAENISGWIREDKLVKVVEDNNESAQEEQPIANNEIQQEEANTNADKVGYVNDSVVNIRKSASTTAEVVMRVGVNTKITIVGEEGDWYKIKLSTGEMAYIMKNLVSDKEVTLTDATN